MTEIERPDVKVLNIWRAEVLTSWGILFLVILGVTIAALATLQASFWWLGIPAAVLAYAVVLLSLLQLRWERWTFQITPFTLEMSHGWLIRRRRIVSRNRIQHVDFESGPIGRRFDLVHVVVHTAGAKVGTIPGIKAERAERLREELMAGPKSL